MNELPVIPTPFSARLRELRLRFLPPLMFLTIVGVCAIVWRNGLQPSSIPAVGDGVRAALSCPQPGTVHELKVQPYQVVQKGEPLAVILPDDPRVPLEMLRTQMQLAQLRMQPSLVEQNALDYERLRVELLRNKTDLALARINLERAESELRRNTPLFKAEIVSADAYELFQKTRNMYRAEVEEKTNNIALIEDRLTQLRSLGELQDSTTNSSTRLLAELARAHVAVASNYGPFILYAPISGMVTLINRQEGEHAVEGEPLMVISGLWSERIVAYLRQPYFVEPRIGMEVQVITRGTKRTRFTAEIAQIGAQMELITNSLAFLRQGALVDVGLPVVVNVPDDVKIRPGEIVDFVIQKPKRSQTAGKNLTSSWRDGGNL